MSRLPADDPTSGAAMSIRRLRVEPLEDRRMLAIVVDTIVDEVDGSIIDGDISLRDAIAAATAGEVITFDGDLFSEGARTLDLVMPLGEIVINKSLTISGPGADLLTIDASGLDFDTEVFGNGGRVFDINDGISGNLLDVTIEGVTLTGADKYEDGGAIRSLENLTLIDSVVIDNQSGRGGGLYNGAGTMEIIGCTIFQNNNDGPQNGHRGSGITNWQGTLIVTDSIVSENGLTICDVCGTYKGGAGIYNHQGSVSIAESTINGNSGGGIYSSGLDAAADVTISNSSISQNLIGFSAGDGLTLSGTETNIQNCLITENQRGGIVNRFGGLTIAETTISGNGIGNEFLAGGIRNSAADLTISSTTISGNTATEEGGGVYHDEGNLSISSSTISGNFAGSQGGGLRIRTSAYNSETVLISNSTISGNTTNWRGGGLWVRTSASDSFDLVHSTVTANTADADSFFGGEGGGLFFFYSTGTDSIDHTIVAGNVRGNGGRDDIDGEIDATYSLVGDDTGATINDNGGNLIGSGGSPIDAMLGPLADNGGPTLTHLPLFNSPALDAGDELAEAGVNSPEFDQRGDSFSRVFDGDGDSIARIDIGAVESDTIYFIVDTLDDHSNGDLSEGDFTLREAIQQATFAGSESVILFDEALFAGGPATILLDFFQQLEIATSMVIQGPGAELLTIEGQNFGRLFYIDDANNFERADVAIRGVTLTGGNDPNGGGAIFSQERLEVADSVITGNTAQWGGGIYSAEFGELTVVNSVVSGNTATSSGGGLYNWGGTVFIFDSTLSDNDSATNGGAILNANNGTLTVSRSTISGNDAEMKGGGLHNGDGNVQITDSTLNGNTADFGGGLYLATPTNDTTTISNSTISNNIAALGGAGLFNHSGQLVIVHSTITENNSNDFAGSGIVTWGVASFAITEIYSTIVAGNHHTDVALSGGFDDTFQSNGYNLIGTGTLANFNQAGDQTNIADPLLGPLADNGGPTLTHTLLTGSSALNAGDLSVATAPEFDQRGSGFSRVVGSSIDIGAYESQTIVVPPSADFDGDGDIDGRDFLLWQRGYGIVAPNAEKIDGDADDDTDVDVDDLDVWQEQYGESEELAAVTSSDPGDATPGLEDEIAFFIAPPENPSVRGYLTSENSIDEIYVAEVDRAIEQYTPVTTSVRSFGEMATRRPIKRVSR
jgi:hypothetical protein